MHVIADFVGRTVPVAGVCSIWWLDSSPVPTLSWHIAPATWRPSFRMPTTLSKVQYPLVDFAYTIWLESYLHLIVSRIAFLCLHWVVWISYLFTELASVCLKNLRRSLSFGGRRHIPSHSEMEAILVSEDTRLTMLNRADESMCHCFFCPAGWEELPSAAHKAAWWKRISLQDSQL